MEFDIIVPSKARPDGSTFNLLRRMSLPFIVVVEKDDVATYTHALSDLQVSYWILPQSNKGIGYSRAYIMKKAARPFVMIDDDITTIYHNGRKSNLTSMLRAGWREFKRQPNAKGVLGFKHTTFALPDRDITFTTTVAHIVFVDPVEMRKQKITYDSKLRAFEDIDLLFKCFMRSIPIRRMNTFVYFTKPSGSHTHGGIEYGKDAIVKKTALDKMVQRYPHMISINENERNRFGQPKYTIYWR